MAGSLNYVALIGHLGSDPEARVMPNGNKVVNVSLATTENWKDKAGNKQSETEWHRLVVYSPLAEIFESYLNKGSSIYVSGKSKTRKWKNKDGADMQTTEVIVREMQMLDSKKQDSGQQGYAKQQNNPAPPDSNSSGDFIESDIPF